MKFYVLIFLFLGSVFYAQEDENESTISDEIVVVGEEGLDTISANNYIKNPLRASLYSAVLPGLGQAYNQKYWKIPIVWTLLGTGAGFVVYYNNEFRRFRDAFIAELNGQPHEFDETTQFDFSAERLADLQDDRRRIRDYAILLTAVVYVLNIVDAAVDAHLFEFDKNPNLTFRPNIMADGVSYNAYAGVSIELKF